MSTWKQPRAAEENPMHFSTSTRLGALAAGLLLSTFVSDGATAEPRNLYVPDGQLQSHLVRIYIDQDLNWTNMPTLRMWGAHALTETNRDEGVPIAPLLIAPQQAYEKVTDRGRVTGTGTMLLFDLRGRKIPQWYKGTARVLPVLEWQAGNVTNVVASPVAVNIGRIGMAAGWMGVLVVALLAVIALFSRSKLNSALALLIGEDGHGSLSRLQLALWTVAVGFSIGVFGIIRATVPGIPTSLVTLMGMSLVTGGISYAAATRDGKPVSQAPDDKPRFKFADLICSYDAHGHCDLSIAKAQMLFWTGVALLLFFVKTFLNGELWDVPAELVTLTGMSQAAYIVPKFWKPETKEPTAAGKPPGGGGGGIVPPDGGNGGGAQLQPAVPTQPAP